MATTRSRPRDKPSVTAEINATERAAEMYHAPSRRLFDDPYARHFVRKPAYRALSSSGPVARVALRVYDRLYGGNHVHVILRYRHYDAELSAALAAGIDQVVLLGAGYDSTAFRRDLGGAVLYEVDTGPTQQAKLDAIRRAGIEPRSRVVYVPCDFEAERPSGRLAEAGFDASRRSLVVWYGVLYYLTEAAGRQTLEDIAVLSAPGSRLIVDYQDPAVIDGTSQYPGARRASKGVRRRGEPLRFGLTPAGAKALVEQHGFAVRDALRVADLVRRYAPPDGVWCNTDDWYGIVTAERVGG